MKKIELILYLLLCVSCNISFSQDGNITVKYTYLLDDAKKDEYGSNDFKKSTLITNGIRSLYFEKNIDTTIVFSSGDDMIFEKNEFVYNHFKDLKNKSILYRDRNIGMVNLIKDENYNINWTITNNTKKVMGYSCQEAIGEFRCRSYKAYFLKDIPMSDGPYKFDGLPGLILEVASDDEAVKISAYEIIIDNDIISNPFKDEKKFISYDEALKKYQLKFDKIANYRDDENGTATIPKRYIECYVK